MKEVKRMNIYAPKGSLVMVTPETAGSGFDYDVEKVSKHLEIGKHYTIQETTVGGWHTDVELVEFPGIHFNSVNFIDVPKVEPKPRFSYSGCHNTYTKDGCRKSALEIIDWLKQQLESDGAIDEIEIEHLFKHLECYEFYRANPTEEEVD